MSLRVPTAAFAIASVMIAIFLTLTFKHDNTLRKDMSKADDIKTDAESIANALKLEGHIEGGYFKRTYQADHRPQIDTDDGERFLMTSIFYMLTDQSPIGHWHLNKSDIMHYFHLGDSIEYSLIYPDGTLEQTVMGSDVGDGEQLQLMVKGGVWKSSRLISGNTGYGLISEAVSPGFDYADMTLADADALSDSFPQHEALIRAYSKQEREK